MGIEDKIGKIFGNDREGEDVNSDQDPDGEGNDHPNRVLTLTKTLQETHEFRTMLDTEEIFFYDEGQGIFLKGGESIIKMQCESLCHEISTHEVSEIVNHIRRRTLTERAEFDSKIKWLVFKNCMLNLKTLERRYHSPDFIATVQIPVIYAESLDGLPSFLEWIEDPLVVCPRPKIIKFMHEVMSDDDVETILDMIAYCLWRALPFHCYVLFNGSGRNGKGVMLEIIRRFLGERNVSGESLHQILSNRFAVARLYGKLANIDADLSKDALKNTGVLKKLTGGDLIRAEEKFLPPFDFINHAKFFFSANEKQQIL